MGGKPLDSADTRGARDQAMKPYEKTSADEPREHGVWLGCSASKREVADQSIKSNQSIKSSKSNQSNPSNQLNPSNQSNQSNPIISNQIKSNQINQISQSIQQPWEYIYIFIYIFIFIYIYNLSFGEWSMHLHLWIYFGVNYGDDLTLQTQNCMVFTRTKIMFQESCRLPKPFQFTWKT